VVPIPHYRHVEGNAPAASYQARFSELVELPRLLVHDPLPDLSRYPLEERRAFRFQTDPHLTRTGHEAMANSLAPTVRSLMREGSVTR
jgi:hypothetical protein